MFARIVALLLITMMAAPALAAETRPWNLDKATSAPVPDENRSGHWWWPSAPSGDAARSEAWGNRGVVYRNLPPAKKAQPSPVQPPPPPPDPP